jgi:hypothetical protein
LSGLEDHVDELTTAFRLIFVNPAQTSASLRRSQAVVGRTLAAIAHALRHSTVGQKSEKLPIINFAKKNFFKILKHNSYFC